MSAKNATLDRYPQSENRTTQRRDRFVALGPGLLIAQALVAVLCLAVGMLATRRDTPVLLVPLTQQAAAGLPLLVMQSGTPLVAHGPTTESLVVIGNNNLPGWRSLLWKGILPLAVDGRLCGNSYSLRSTAA